MLNFASKREWRRRATKVFRRGMATLGQALPQPVKISLARRSTKWGHLLTYDGDFEIPDYLSAYKVNINAKYSMERVMLTGEYEKDLWWTVRNYVSPGDVCIDVGANVGAVTLFLAKAVGAEGKVFAFEPGPVFSTRLKENVQLNAGLSSIVEVHQLGLSDKKGKLYWEEDPDFPGNAYLFGNKGTEIEVVTLDDFLSSRVERLDFIKIDVEGMEEEVLRGSINLIARLKPKVFFETLMDFEIYRQAPIRKRAAELLLALGYRLFRVEVCENEKEKEKKKEKKKESETLIPVTYPNFSSNTLALPPPDLSTSSAF